MLKPKEKEGARGICRCKSPAQIHKPYLFLTLSTAFSELANHSAAKVAQHAFLRSWEQLARALSTRDWTFAFAYFFFHQEKQVRESPGLGRWEAEKENPLGPSLGDSDPSLHFILVRQTSVQITVPSKLTQLGSENTLPAHFYSRWTSPAALHFPNFRQGPGHRRGNLGWGEVSDSGIATFWGRKSKDSNFFPSTSLVNPESTESIKISSLELGWPCPASAAEARGRWGEGGGGEHWKARPPPTRYTRAGRPAGLPGTARGGLRNRAGGQRTPKLRLWDACLLFLKIHLLRVIYARTSLIRDSFS